MLHYFEVTEGNPVGGGDNGARIFSPLYEPRALVTSDIRTKLLYARLGGGGRLVCRRIRCTGKRNRTTEALQWSICVFSFRDLSRVEPPLFEGR